MNEEVGTPAGGPTPRRRIRPLSRGQTLAAAAALWLIVATAAQRGWRGIGLLLGLFFAAAFAAAVLSLLRQDASTKPLRFVQGALLLATGFWFYFAGSHLSWSTLAWDVGGIAVGGLAGTAFLALALAIIERKQQRKTRLLSESHDALPVCTMLAGWLAISLFTVWRQAPLPRDLTRFDRIGPAASIVPAQSQRWQSLRVGVALSGGGYRAAVYHAGVLHALETLGIRVDVLSTVSGGSIIGAYYAVGGEPQAFKDAVADGRFNLRRELALLHNALRLPFPFTVPVLDVRLFKWYEHSRGDVQAGLLRRTLFDGDESWRTPAPRQPRLVVNVTDLTFGTQVGLLPDGAVMLWPGAPPTAYRGPAWRLDEPLALAERVAVSGAFPGAFPARAVSVRAQQRDLPDDRLRAFDHRSRPMLLADGGIFDNSGAAMLRSVDHFARLPAAAGGIDAGLASDIGFVSDAGAIFGVKPALGDIAQVVRAADVGAALARRGGADRPQVTFSAQERFAPPWRQFQVYGAAALVRDLTGPERVERAFTGSGFDRGGDYPAPVLAAMAALLPARPGPADTAALRRALESSMDGRLEQFRNTSTLDDLLPRERVEDLYALGQLMVYTAWPRIEREMESALAQPRAAGGRVP